ncbi:MULTISPECIES: DUF302 domain-containing protein [Thermus]|jgi:uncharacterized protein (DUF302 family)|uniref:DUF302 domain-containing protein n=1 Tax=Thermus brockianus TaxID=56956 RepID=A0A1J0LSR2_THEBO|nr:DUF302 domain-containing protein [Thermus brockianus]APD09393.1 hypothetical protein A0O31_01258 [Thermus brockianus]
MEGLALRKTLPGSLSEVRPRLEAALKEEGFGILTEIDVAATLKARLGLERPPYLILGACNPNLAARALEAEEGIGLLLPCNVVLRQEGGNVEVLVQDPEGMFRLLPPKTQEALKPVAQEAKARLERALARL